MAAPPEAETVWFTTTRARILVGEDTFSLVEEEAEQGNMPPLHLHVDHDEVFYVLSGRLSVHLPGSCIYLGAGQAAFAPREIPHTRRVESEEGARWLVATTSGGYAAFVAEVAIPRRRRRVRSRGGRPGSGGSGCSGRARRDRGAGTARHLP